MERKYIWTVALSAFLLLAPSLAFGEILAPDENGNIGIDLGGVEPPPDPTPPPGPPPGVDPNPEPELTPKQMRKMLLKIHRKWRRAEMRKARKADRRKRGETFDFRAALVPKTAHHGDRFRRVEEGVIQDLKSVAMNSWDASTSVQGDSEAAATFNRFHLRLRDRKLNNSVGIDQCKGAANLALESGSRLRVYAENVPRFQVFQTYRQQVKRFSRDYRRWVKRKYAKKKRRRQRDPGPEPVWNGTSDKLRSHVRLDMDKLNVRCELD